MAESSWPQHALTVGFFDFRGSVRAIWQDTARVAFVGFGMLIFPLMLVVFVIVFAETIRGIGPLPVPEQLRGTIALSWLFAVFLIGQRVVSARTRINAEPLMLTTVSARTVAVGLLVGETLRGLAYLGLPALILAGAGVYLFGSLASLIVVPAAALLFTATAVVTGAVVGYTAAWLVATSQFVARHKMKLGTAVALVGMGGYSLFLYPQIGGVSSATLAWLPMGWFADLVVVGTPFRGSFLRQAGGLLGSALVLLIGGAIVERETIALWLTTSVNVNTAGTARESDVAKGKEFSRPARHDALAAMGKPLVVPRLVSLPTRRVAEWVLLRTRRNPNRLMYLVIPVITIGGSLIGEYSESLDALAAPVCAVLLPWLAGSLFALNPLGDEGTVLPVTLTAVSGTQYVRGLMVPSLFLGLPIVTILTAIAGLFSPYTLTEQYGLVALGIYLTCVSITITPAIGIALPRFSAISVGQSQEVLPPRMSAVILHLTVTVIPGALLALLVISPKTARAVLAGLFGFVPAFLLELLIGPDNGLLATAAAWFIDIGKQIQTVSLGKLQGIGGGVVLIGGVIIAILLYQNAIHRFERYSPP